MIFSSLTKREKIIFFITCLIIAASVLWRIIVGPFVGEWLSLDKRLIAAQVRLQKGYKLLNTQASIKKEYQRYESLMKSSQSDEREMAGILTEIERLSRDSNIYISVLKPYTTKDFDFYKKFVVEVETDSSIGDLTKFLYKLQGSQKILKVENMDISTKSDQPGFVKSRLLVSRITFLK